MNSNELLREIAEQLDKWAKESLTDGWCTHQVEPMQKLANKIYVFLGRQHG